MKKLNLIIGLFIGLFLASSCQKAGLSSSGKEISIIRQQKDFTHLQLWDNIDIELTQDSLNSLEIIAGENLMDKIESKTEDGILILSNQNRFNWLRSYSKPIRILLHFKNLNEIEIHGTGNISCTNPIESDSLMLNVWDAAGKVELNIHTKKSSIRYHIGTASISYRGISRLSYISSNSYGPVDARNLQSEQTYISTKGSNNNYVWASEILEATISSIGNIYYKGDPKILKTFLNGSGKVEKIEP